MRNITLSCPECRTPSKAVGNPDEHANGHTGPYHCFACGSNGTFVVVMTPSPRAPLASVSTTPLPPAAAA